MLKARSMVAVYPTVLRILLIILIQILPYLPKVPINNSPPQF